MVENLQQLNYLHLFYFWNVVREGSMTAACERLHVTQPTISTQIRKLEQALGLKLFDRVGRGLQLTKAGHTIFEYAEEIFSLGQALLGSLNGGAVGNSAKLVVGIPNVLPKLITCRLLEPVLQGPQRIHLICHEASLNELIADLAVHRFDVIISDLPIAPTVRVKSFNHPLGESAIAFCGVKKLADRFRRGFPDSLDGAPLLLPTSSTDLRRSLDRWFEARGIRPWLAAEFDDSALMKEFGKGGLGLFPIPAAVVQEVVEQYSVAHVGTIEEVRARYYAITTERKLKNPAVVAIAEAARHGLLDPA